MLLLFQNVCVHFPLLSEMLCIVQEAGGKVTDMNGNVLPLTAGSILASNGGILHDRIVQLVSD